MKIRWLAFSILGLLFSGFGISLIGEAIILKLTDGAWFWMGTAGLTTFHTGLSLFGQGIIYRVRMLQEKR